MAVLLFIFGTALSSQGWYLMNKATQQGDLLGGIADECRALRPTLAAAASSDQSAKPAATVLLAAALASQAFVDTEHAELRRGMRDLSTSLADYNYRVSHLHIGSHQPFFPLGVSDSAAQSLQQLDALGDLLAERYDETC